MEWGLILAILGILAALGDWLAGGKSDDTISRPQPSSERTHLSKGPAIACPKQPAQSTSAPIVSSVRSKTPLVSRPKLTEAEKKALLVNLAEEDRKVLKLVLKEWHNLEIADELEISAVHASLLQRELRKKFRVDTNAELIELIKPLTAADQGWTSSQG